MRIAACQMVSGTDIEANLQTAQTLIRSAQQSGAELVVLPEYFAYLPKWDKENLTVAETFGDGPIQNAMSEVARQGQIWLVAGSIVLKADDDSHFIDASLVYNPNGEVEARYDKIHLFQFDRGNEHYHEDEFTQAGKTLTTLPIESWEGAWRIGLAVCYDLRFPELFRGLDSPDIITLPASFTTTTGRAHWETLVKARAIENQCYVIACAQGGDHESGRQTWGHSLVVDPWGMTVAELTRGEGVLLADITKQRLNEVRTLLPALKGKVIK